jgi:hypothetical protein
MGDRFSLLRRASRATIADVLHLPRSKRPPWIGLLDGPLLLDKGRLGCEFSASVGDAM